MPLPGRIAESSNLAHIPVDELLTSHLGAKDPVAGEMIKVPVANGTPSGF